MFNRKMLILFNTFGILLVYFICNLCVSAEKRKCSSQHECVNKGVEPCSICVNDDGKSGKCIDIYPNTYISSPSCVKYDDTSCPLKCNGRGKCYTTTVGVPNSPYYHPYCRCYNRTRYGENCQYDNINRLPVLSYVKIRFDADKPILACETTVIEFTLHSWIGSISSTRKIEIFVRVGDLNFKGYPISLLHRDTSLKNFRGTLAIKTVFPYKSFETSYTLESELIGYHIGVQLNVYVEEQIEFNNSWNIFVKYEYLSCLPKIYPTNCGLSMLAPAEFLRSHLVVIDIDVKYIDDGKIIYKSTHNPKCKVSEKVSWYIWKLSNGRSTYLPWFEHVATSKRLSFKPHSIEIGIYEVLIEVTNTGQERPVSNVAQCYFKVSCSPLVAKIVGGNNRMVSPNLELVLRADNSYDPNMPSDDQNHLNIEWTCVNILNPKKHDSLCDARQLTVSEIYYVPSNRLTPGAIYNFTLKVWTDKYDKMPDCNRNDISPKFSFVIIKVAPLNDTESGDFLIECLKNCGRKVVSTNHLFLKAVDRLEKGSFLNTTYEWNYYKNDEHEKTADSIRIDAFRSYLLIIKEDSLDSGSNYTIVARIQHSTRYAKYYFETYSTGIEADCSLEPHSGIKGFTQFKINCTVHNNPSLASLTFEFYDKYEEEMLEGIIYNGRMLGTSKEGRLVNVRLTREHLLIYIVGDNGMLYLKIHIDVKIDDWLINEKILREIYQNATNELRFGSIPSTLGAISFIPDIIPEFMNNNKSDILCTLLGFVTQLAITDLGNMKLCALTLTNILLTMNKPKQFQIKPHYIAAVFKTIKQETDIFAGRILSGGIQNTSPKEVKQIAITLLDCLQAGLLCREKQTEGIDGGAFDLSTQRELKQASIYISTIIDLITNVLSYMQVPGQPVTKISSRSEMIVVWVMENDETLSLPELLSKSKEVPVKISDELYNNAAKRLNKNENLALQVVSMEDNIYWWSLSDVGSRLVSVSLKRQSNNNHILPIKYLYQPITIFINLNDNLTNSKTQESTSMSGSGMNPFSSDLGIKIHRFDPAMRSLMAIKFLYPPTNGSLRVLVMEHFRPDYEIMLKRGKIINTHSPEYYVPYYGYDEPYFLYMGVMPGPDIGNSQDLTYTFEVNTTVCNTWTKGQWSSAGCHIRRVKSGKQVQCECTHFSIFSAAFPIPPNSVDPFADARLFLTVIYNPFVVALVIVLLLMYLLLFLYVWKTHRHDEKKKTIIILEDNFLYDEVPYLVAVFTGPRISAGTSAHVGIKLIGTQANSRSHILRCKDRTVLKTNSDDWFLIFCPEYLGDVEGVHIWHDNSGPSPDWLCEKVVVYDLSEKTETLFVVDEWVSLNNHEFPEVYVLSAAMDDIINIKSLFLYNLILTFRESYALLSFVVCHPRSEMPKILKLNVFMCSLFITMLSSIMFYVPKYDLNYVDDYQYFIEKRNFYIGIQSMFICVVICFFIYFLFRKSYKITYDKHKSTIRVRHHNLHDKSIIYTFENKQREYRAGTLYGNFLRVVNHIIKSNIMEPVQLPDVEPILKVQRIWLLISWTVFIAVIVLCSYLIMLYGLKFGSVRSKKWLSSLLIATCGDFLFVGPLRIIFLSTMVAISLQKMFDLDVHKVHIEDLKLIQTPKEPEYNHNVAIKRNNPMYKPLQKLERNKILAREKNRRMRNLIYDFLINILLLVVLKNLIFERWIQNFNANTHVVEFLTLKKHEVFGTVDFFNIRNILSFEEYLQYTLVNCLYNLRWYNSQLLHSDANTEKIEYWASDYSLRLLGLPIIKQIRVVPGFCGNLIFREYQCLPHWSSENEDKDDYGERWKPAIWPDVVRNNSPWRYSERPGNCILTRYRFYSPSSVSCSAGGYIVVLGPTRKDTELKVAELIEFTWMNSRTRAVFIEFSVYNVNLHLFIHVTLIVEYLASGAVLPKAQAMLFRTGTLLDTWNVLYVVLVFYYLFRCVKIINRHGFKLFLSHFPNVCKISIVSLGFLSLFLFPIHYKASTYYLEILRRHGFYHYFDFDSIANDYLLLRRVLSLSLCISALHATALIKTGKGLTRHFNTLFLSINCIFWLTFCTVVIITSLVGVLSWIGVRKYMNFDDITINKKSLGGIQLNEFQYLHVQLFVLFKIVSITIWLWWFLIHFMFCNKLAKLHHMYK